MPAPGHEKDLARAASTPLRDLSIVREAAPAVLLRAAVAPYDTAALQDCASSAAELAALDAVLGPDLGLSPKRGHVDVHGGAGDVVGGAVGLPYRGLVRWATGAAARDDALRADVLAGMVRRGFVKGRRSLMSCPPP
jgi:hypothetical protein